MGNQKGSPAVFLTDEYELMITFNKFVIME